MEQMRHGVMPLDGRAAFAIHAFRNHVRKGNGIPYIAHLFHVAAGLDSVVLGEDQILHQLRDCLADRHIPGASRCPVEIGSASVDAMGLDPVLARLFQTAAHLGRETRSWREGPPRSLADVVLDRIVRVTGPVAGRRILVVGAGRMARLVALAASRARADVLVANRDADRAAALAFDAGGAVAAFGHDAPLPEADAVVLAISGPWPVSPGARTDLLASGLPVVDLSSPPAVDPPKAPAAGVRAPAVPTPSAALVLVPAAPEAPAATPPPLPDPRASRVAAMIAESLLEGEDDAQGSDGARVA